MAAAQKRYAAQLKRRCGQCRSPRYAHSMWASSTIRVSDHEFVEPAPDGGQ